MTRIVALIPPTSIPRLEIPRRILDSSERGCAARAGDRVFDTVQLADLVESGLTAPEWMNAIGNFCELLLALVDHRPAGIPDAVHVWLAAELCWVHDSAQGGRPASGSGGA